MSSSSPAVLPITNPQNTGTVTDSTTPISAPALRLFVTHMTETVRTGVSNRRPWAELIDRTAFSKPDSLSEATLRIRKNYSYFRTNYLTLLAVILTVSLLTNPLSLLSLLSLLAAWVFLYLFRPSDPPLVLLGRTFSERETLGFLVLATVVVVFLTSVGSVLISSLMVGVALVCAHGAFRVPEDLFLDDQEQVSTGFLSFLSAPSATSAAASVVAGRV